MAFPDSLTYMGESRSLGSNVSGIKFAGGGMDGRTYLKRSGGARSLSPRIRLPSPAAPPLPVLLQQMAGFGGGLAGLGPDNCFHKHAAWVRRPRAFDFRFQTRPSPMNAAAGRR